MAEVLASLSGWSLPTGLTLWGKLVPMGISSRIRHVAFTGEMSTDETFFAKLPFSLFFLPH